MSEKMYVAIGPNVFVKEAERETKFGDWIIPDSLDVDFTYGEVISCGEGYFKNGSFVPSPVGVGDKVAFPKVSGTKVSFNGHKYVRVFMEDIVAKEVEGHIVDDKENKTLN